MTGLSVHVRSAKYNQYDSSLKLFIASGGSSVVAYDLGVPRSTVAGWRGTDFSHLITHPFTGSPRNELRLFR